MTRRVLSVVLVLAVLSGAAAVSTVAVAAPARASTVYVGDRILDEAETRTGDWYAYGAAGPTTFDCSGLVWWAATAIGERDWPRDTYDIAAEIGSRFTITDHPQRGDLAMWGPAWAPYHVELVTIYSWLTYGIEAPTWAGRAGWHPVAWFPPSFYLHINW